MKIQDIFFFIVLIITLILVRKSKVSAFLGLICLVIAIPLFTKWIFFTAERLTWYAAGFFLISSIQLIYENRN